MSFLDAAGLRAVGPERFVATLADLWTSMLGIHGGYVVSIAAHAIEMVVGDEDRALRSVTAQFLRPPLAGDVEIAVEVVQAGRSVSFLRASVHQLGRPVVVVSAVAGHARGGLEFEEVVRPDWAGRPVPPDAERFVVPDEARASSDPNHDRHFEQFGLQLEPGVRFLGGNDIARVAGWMRPLDPAERLSIPWMVCAADVMPPSMVFRTDRPVQAASIELAVQLVRAQPEALVAPGQHVYGEMRAWVSREGFTVEDGTFWSPAGVLLATSRQVRLAGT